MSLTTIYWRVLKQLGPEARLGVVLALANVALAGAQFAEPVLFGRIVDTLSKAQATGVAPTWDQLMPLIGAWVLFGLFTIGAGVLIALHADRKPARLRVQAHTQHGAVLALGGAQHVEETHGRRF